MSAISIIMTIVMMVTSLLTPGLATAEEFRALWMSRPVSQTTSVVVPSEQWTPMLRVKKTNIDQLSSYEYRSGERWLTLSREEAALVPNLKAAEMSTIMRIPRKNVVMIFGRYVPQSAELVIDAIKVEESRDGYMNVYHTYFTPYHGEHWKLSRAYLTDAESADVSRAGRNPFESFKAPDRTDPRFINIGFDAASVALGLAQKRFRTPFSVLSVQNLRMNQSVTKSGSFLRKKTTIKVDGYAQPSWFIGMPSTLQTWGTSAAICVIPTAMTTDPKTGLNQGAGCSDEKLVAFAGVTFDEWKGKMMPEAEEHIYHWEQTKGGFTVLFFTILIMVAAFFVGPAAFAAASGSGFGGAAIGGLEAALTAGAAYAGGSLVTSSGPSSMTDVKRGIFGGIGDGRLNASDPGSQQAKDATAILTKRHIDVGFTLNSTCSDDGALCSTQKGMNNITPNPNQVVFTGDQKMLRQQALYCSRVLGVTSGDEFNACVVPSRPPVDIP